MVVMGVWMHLLEPDIHIYIYTWLNFKDGSTLSNMPTRMFNLHCSLPRHHGSMNARTV
jgi:hypothetical protein